MSAVIQVEATGNGMTDVQVELFNGAPTQLIFVDLQGTDHLVATRATQSQTLVKSQLATIIDYTSTFAGDTGGDTFTIALARSVDAGAPNSIATLPAALTLGALPATASRNAPLTVTWDASHTTDVMKWRAEGTCIVTAQADTITDTGSTTIPAGTLAKTQGANVPDTCTVTLSLSRYRPGSLDPRYGDGGSIVGQQTRTMMFTTTP
jgi:hypothetical protein